MWVMTEVSEVLFPRSSSVAVPPSRALALPRPGSAQGVSAAAPGALPAPWTARATAAGARTAEGSDSLLLVCAGIAVLCCWNCTVRNAVISYTLPALLVLSSGRLKKCLTAE